MGLRMSKWLGHSSTPFLTAAAAALVSYRFLESGLGLSKNEIFVAGFGGALALAAAVVLASLLVRASQE
jgi:hypothetical protein